MPSPYQAARKEEPPAGRTRGSDAAATAAAVVAFDATDRMIDVEILPRRFFAEPRVPLSRTDR